MAPVSSWVLHGRSLWDYFNGDTGAVITVRSDLGEHDELPVAGWFRTPGTSWGPEQAALELCRGRVLDVGAGAGVHSLVLQERGLSVCAIDFVPQAVEIMRRRGVRDVHQADLFRFEFSEPFDTVLMFANGAGICETLAGLDRFLRWAPRLLTPGGQILVDSTDVRGQAGREWRDDGRYIGEIEFQLEYRGAMGAPFPQLYVDSDTLAGHAGRAGWSVNVVAREGASYLAQLRRVK